MTPDLSGAARDLYAALGDYLVRHRTDGIFELAALRPDGAPTLYLDVLPQPVTDGQRSRITALGYRWMGERDAVHPGGWSLRLSDPDSGEWQGALALSEYREVDGARVPDLPTARAWKIARLGFTPLRQLRAALAGLKLPWMVSAGWALDLLAGQPERLHDDVDVVLTRGAQAGVRDALRSQGWRLDACVEGMYLPWDGPLPEGAYQVHARHPDFGARLLDLMFSDLSDGVWRYRRDPRVGLPLAEARRPGPEGLPFLAPQAVLLFKGAGSRGVRAKDQADFERTLPRLKDNERAWLVRHLPSGHAWHAALTDQTPT